MMNRCSICAKEAETQKWGHRDFSIMYLCLKCMAWSSMVLMENLVSMARAYSEKRSDVTESIYDIIKGHEFSSDWISSRFVRATLPSYAGNKIVMFDTLTGQLEIFDEETPTEAIILDCEYIG